MAENKSESFDLHFGDVDQYLFGHGRHYEIYKKMGAHPVTIDGQKGTWFTVWAPNAARISVVGAFNGWDAAADPLTRVTDGGVYEAFVPGAAEGELYKYRIVSSAGTVLYKADPYAFSSELRPGTASRIADISSYLWKDENWMKRREEYEPAASAMSIYEVHPGSWRRHAYREEDSDGFMNYEEFAEELAAYVKEMGYTHVELMGIAEHPFDGSWGYQVTGYYAPSVRYGTPGQFKYLVDTLHREGIGVFLDWVPAHFPRDAHGLAMFDGTAVYEHADPRQGEHPEWGTKIFNYGRPEVSNFLIANALYWVEQYHVDGLRVDAVAAMLYLDYGKKDGQWVANKYGGNENLDAIEFFRHLNSIMEKRNKGVSMIAEESTAWPKVTGDPAQGGLGFTLKWNMGWMHDFLEYMQLDPYFRKFNHNKMTFTMTYAFSEHYILVLSHDEVVHLKHSMLGKMPGTPQEKFKNLMIGYTYMIGHPGKKLLFMGQEFGQLREWSEERELDWYLLTQEDHAHLQTFVKELLHLYRKYPALYAGDTSYDGFEWVNANDSERSIFSFIRKSPTGRNNLLFVLNFTPVARRSYRVGVPKKKSYELILDSEDARFGGSHKSTVHREFTAEKKVCDGKPYSIAYHLPAFGAAIFRF